MITATIKAKNQAELEAFLIREGFRPLSRTPSGAVHEWGREECWMRVPANAKNTASGILSK